MPASDDRKKSAPPKELKKESDKK